MTGTVNKRAALVAVTGGLVAGSGCADTGARDRSEDHPGAAVPERTDSGQTTTATELSEPQLERPRPRLATRPGLKLGSARRADCIRAAQDFAVGVTRWLYGERERLDVGPLTPAARRELASAPPYIPPDQRGTGEGRVHLLELALQTERSGVVTVTINDVRTSYRVPAALELRDGRWQIVHLNTH
jgi:hypothetical protein